MVYSQVSDRLAVARRFRTTVKPAESHRINQSSSAADTASPAKELHRAIVGLDGTDSDGEDWETDLGDLSEILNESLRRRACVLWGEHF